MSTENIQLSSSMWTALCSIILSRHTAKCVAHDWYILDTSKCKHVNTAVHLLLLVSPNIAATKFSLKLMVITEQTKDLDFRTLHSYEYNHIGAILHPINKRCHKQCTPDISRFWHNDLRKTSIARPLGRCRDVFREFEFWSKFYFRNCCAVRNIVLYCNAIYLESIVLVSEPGMARWINCWASYTWS